MAQSSALFTGMLHLLGAGARRPGAPPEAPILAKTHAQIHIFLAIFARCTVGGGGEGGLGSEGEREAWWRRGRGRPPSGSSPLLRLALLPFSAWLFSPPLEPVGACREERERETALGKSSMGGPSGSAAPPPWGSTRRRFLQVAVFMAAPWWEGREREARWEGREREAALGSSPLPSLGSSPLSCLVLTA